LIENRIDKLGRPESNRRTWNIAFFFSVPSVSLCLSLLPSKIGQVDVLTPRDFELEPSEMKPVSNEVIERQLAWRYATKVFDTAKTIPDADWETLEKSLVLCPSSWGLQPWKFFVVTDPALKAKLKAASWNQSQITDASHVIVFAIKKDLNVTDIDNFIARTAEVRETTVESLAGFRKMLVGMMVNPPFDINEWAARQAYIAIGFFMATAAMLGIDVCPIEGFEPSKYDEILGLSAQGCTACVVAAAGYRSNTDKYANLPKVRYKTEDVVTRI
jgi:nitroreductase